ncbi:MAG: class I SAM-dependent methyltransferase [Eubacteriales bacterium]|nr:class I SAM-dependent methyltransferase [Eubacteriales bacterium]
MAYNYEFVHEKYQFVDKEEGRFSESRASGLEARYTKKQLDLLVNEQSSVIELGCATGYYGLYLADKCHSYLGVDIIYENVEKFAQKIKDGGYWNLSAKLGDATQLDFIEPESFDVVLVLGPMYHLNRQDRGLVFKESIRICMPGGKICYAYISLLGVYAGACILSPGQYPNSHANKCLFVYGVNDVRPDLFFFSTPEEMEKNAKEHGLSILKNIGLDFFFAANIVNNMSDEQFNAWLVLNDRMAESEACTGLSNHAMLVCEKQS